MDGNIRAVEGWGEEEAKEKAREKIMSDLFRDYVLDIPLDLDEMRQKGVLVIPLDDRYSVAYSREEADIPWEKGENPFRYRYIPKLYGLMQEEGTENRSSYSDIGENIILGEDRRVVREENLSGRDDTALVISGIKRVQRPPLSLTGKGCIICIIDTGIDYIRPEFRDELGESRILAIWDQEDTSGNPPDGFFYGREYSGQEINQALNSEKPYDIVASRDVGGHGTDMALLAAGTEGAAGDAYLVIVKLKEAKPFYKQFYQVREGAPAYEETDICLAIKYGDQFAKALERPVVFCLGLGTSMGDHSGKSFLAEYIGKIGQKRSRCMVVCGGNEGNSGHHYRGQMNPDETYKDVELRVGEERGLTLEFWGELPDIYRIVLRSPGGETISVANHGINSFGTYGFIYEETLVTVESVFSESNSGKEWIRFRFQNPTPGIWTLRVLPVGLIHYGVFHMWLPIQEFLQDETYFLTPDPYVTMTDPAMNRNVLSVNGYDAGNDSFYLYSGRGNNTDQEIKPDLAAPAVNLPGRFGKVSGSSYAAAITAGAAAQLMEWAVVRKNSVLAETTQIKNLLVQGARRKPAYSYPNREWGYGALNLQGVFDALAGINE